MVESLNISIGGVIVKRLSPYIHTEDKGETYERTLNKKLIINRVVTTENQPITKYHFEIPGLEDDQLDNIRVASLKKSDLYLIDYYSIHEVLSGDGETKTFYAQRIINTAAGMVVTVDGEIVTPTVTLNDSGRGKLVFDTAPSNSDDNIDIKYIPKYLVYIFSWNRTFIYNGLLTYIIVCEEVK